MGARCVQQIRSGGVNGPAVHRSTFHRSTHRPGFRRGRRDARRGSVSTTSKACSTLRCRRGSPASTCRSCRTPSPKPRCSPSCARSPARNRLLRLDDRHWATTAPLTPSVILRNVLENPAWYTAYTPYQPEISQGRLEALLNFQTMVTDLTGARRRQRLACSTRRTAAAEAMALRAPGRRAAKRRRSSSTPTAIPQTIDVVSTRAEAARRQGRRRPISPTRTSTWRASSACSLQYPRHVRSDPRPRPAGRRGVHAAGALLVGRRRPAGADPADAARRARRRRRGRHHPALRRAAGLRRPARRPTWPSARLTSGSCPGRLVGVVGRRRRPPGATGWRCRPASSTSAARRRPATSAPRRCCSPSSPRCTPM